MYGKRPVRSGAARVGSFFLFSFFFLPALSYLKRSAGPESEPVTRALHHPRRGRSIRFSVPYIHTSSLSPRLASQGDENNTIIDSNFKVIIIISRHGFSKQKGATVPRNYCETQFVWCIFAPRNENKRG